MKFTANQKLATRSTCNAECIFDAVVIKRTDKTVTILVDSTEKRCKVHNDSDGAEFIFPFGRYSMAPIFRANRDAV